MKSRLVTVLLGLVMVGLLGLAVPFRQRARETRQRQTLDDLTVGSTVLVTYEQVEDSAELIALQIDELTVEEREPAGSEIKGTLESVDARRGLIVVNRPRKGKIPEKMTFGIDERTIIVTGQDPEIAELSDLGAATILLMGGFRGLAVNVLWLRSIALHQERRYHEERAILDVIIRLQPRYANVWVYQAWNIAYNMSVQYESEEEQFKWIQEGRDFLLKGQRILPKNPDVAFWLGIMYSQKYAAKRAYGRLLEEQEGINNFEEGARWYDRARTLIREGRELSVFHPRLADTGVYYCCESRYKQILELGTVGPTGFDRKTLAHANVWRDRALDEIRGLTERWPKDAAIPGFGARLAGVPVEAYVSHARQAMLDGGLSPEAEQKARRYLNLGNVALNRLIAQYGNDQESRSIIESRRRDLFTFLPFIYLEQAEKVIEEGAQAPLEKVRQVKRWIERGRALIESLVAEEKRDELLGQIDELLKKADALIESGASSTPDVQ